MVPPFFDNDFGVPPVKWSTFWDNFIPRYGGSKDDSQMTVEREKAEDIVMKLRQVGVLQGQGKSVSDAVRHIGVTEVTYYRWRSEYGGLKGDQVKRLKELEAENNRLRRAVSDLTIEKLILKEAARGNF